MDRFELMVGDWVMRTDVKDPYPVQILEINEYSVVVDNQHGNTVILDYTDLQPIPITREFLLKENFIEQENRDFKTFYNQVCFGDKVDYTIIFETEEGSDNDRIIYSIIEHEAFLYNNPMYYIHEFQHVLKLSNINYEIKL